MIEGNGKRRNVPERESTSLPIPYRGAIEAFPIGQVILFEQYRLLRRTWWWVLLISAVAAVAAFLYVTNVVTPEYAATAVVVPPRKSGTPLDNLLGDVAAGFKGLSISKLIGKKGDESGYSTFSILSSQPIKDSLIRKYRLYDVYDLPKERPDLVAGQLSGRMEFVSDLEGPISITVYDADPERAADMANDAVAFTNTLLYDLNKLETEPITRFVAERYEQLKSEQEGLSQKLEAFMKRTNIYEPEAQLPATSTALIEARVNESTLRASLNMLEKMLGPDDPAVIQQKGLLEASIAERQKLESGGSGVGPGVRQMPAALMEYARLKQDYEVNAQLLALIEPMYQQTVYDEQRDIPQLIVLSEATPPYMKARPKRSVVVLATFIGAALLCYLIIALAAYSRSFSRRYRLYASNGMDEQTVVAVKQEPMTE